MTSLAHSGAVPLRRGAGADEILRAAPRLEAEGAEATVRWALARFDGDGVAVVTGLQAEGMVVVDLAVRTRRNVRIVTVDTGRLPEETHAYIDTVRRHYGVTVEVVLPDPEPVTAYVAEHGANAIFDSLERRLDCCHVRKVLPLEGVLDGLDCWLTGLRRTQSSGRRLTPVVERDLVHGGLTKVNPLAAWSENEVHEYLERHGVPRHPLYERGYRSIGCAPCTRPCAPGDDVRSGRWWWESESSKECGIHGRPAVAPIGGGHDQA